MTFEAILVPTDFSRGSKMALSLAVALASSSKETSIVLLHVVEASVPACDEELGVLEPEKSFDQQRESAVCMSGKN